MTDDPAETGDEGKMSLLEHLVELRTRLMWSVGSFVICFFVAYYFANPVFNFLVQPLADMWVNDAHPRRLIFTAMQEKFFTDL